MPKSEKTEDVDSIIKDNKKRVEVTLPDSGETVCMGKLFYAQMKSVTRITDGWERNDQSILESLKNGGTPRTQEWLDNLDPDDVIAMSTAFASLSGAPRPLEDWLTEKHPSVLKAYQKEVEAGLPRRGSNPLRGSSTRVMDSPSFG